MCITSPNKDLVLVGGRATEPQRKWMSSKPLISTWTRDGQAYETGFKTFNSHPQDQRLRIVPRHDSNLFCPLIFCFVYLPQP